MLFPENRFLQLQIAPFLFITTLSQDTKLHLRVDTQVTMELIQVNITILHSIKTSLTSSHPLPHHHNLSHTIKPSLTLSHPLSHYHTLSRIISTLSHPLLHHHSLSHTITPSLTSSPQHHTLSYTITPSPTPSHPLLHHNTLSYTITPSPTPSHPLLHHHTLSHTITPSLTSSPHYHTLSHIISTPSQSLTQACSSCCRSDFHDCKGMFSWSQGAWSNSPLHQHRWHGGGVPSKAPSPNH